MLALLSLIPGLGTVIQSIVTAVFNAKVQITQAKVGADVQTATAIVQASVQQEHENTARLSIIGGNKLLTVLLVAFAVPLVVFEYKVIIFDKVLHLGTTDPLTGQVADWANTVVYFLFGAPTALTIGRMWFSRSSK